VPTKLDTFDATAKPLLEFSGNMKVSREEYQTEDVGHRSFFKRFVFVHVLGSGKVFYREKSLGWNTHAFELSSTSFTRLKSPSTILLLLPLLLVILLLSTIWSPATMFCVVLVRAKLSNGTVKPPASR